jgi:hypothetical protein
MWDIGFMVEGIDYRILKMGLGVQTLGLRAGFGV